MSATSMLEYIVCVAACLAPFGVYAILAIAFKWEEQ